MEEGKYGAHLSENEEGGSGELQISQPDLNAQKDNEAGPQAPRGEQEQPAWIHQVES